MSRKAQSNALLWMAEMVIFSGLFVMVGITSVDLIKQTQIESTDLVATEILETLIASEECLRVPGSIAKGVIELLGAEQKGDCIQKYPYVWKAEIKDFHSSTTTHILPPVNLHYSHSNHCDFPTYASIPVTIDKGSSGHKKGVLKVEVGSLAFRANPRIQGGELFLTFDSFADCDMNLNITENWYEKGSTEPDYIYVYNETGALSPSIFKLNETWYGEKTRDFAPNVYKHGREITDFSKYDRYSLEISVVDADSDIIYTSRVERFLD
ncbi:TPA: hypothetical protein H1011_00875 [archaeon]|uniref:Uncharacterized protein n=1 Tax=Candidatus Undinarchaeum marinum TaxID=2756141 RepID=A0A832XL33_9ARCH|nr:hypothetical protein [Candidatus Undinarchaeum marinum]